MTITTLTPVATSAATAVAVPEPPVSALAPVITLDDRRRRAVETSETGETGEWHLGEAGAASAEYAAVTACGVGLAGVLLKLLTSDFGQNLLKTLIEFFLKMVGIG